MLSASAASREQLDDLLVHGRAARDHRAHRRARSRPARFGSPPRIVGRRRHVDRERDLRVEPVGRDARAVEPDLLLHGRNRDHVDLRLLRLGDPPRRLQRDVGAEPVVERARERRPFGSSTGGAVPDRDVADADEPFRLLARRGADVDVQVGELGRGRSRICSGGMRFRAIAPGMGPLSVRSSIRWPISISGEMPPTVVNESRPFSSMFVTATPISSMWPTSASVIAPSPARTRANELPSVSEVTSAKDEAASRQMRAGASS